MLPALLLTLAATAAPTVSRGDTVWVEVGSEKVDGRVYKPHAARVRVWTDKSESKMATEWTNVLTIGDSAGREVHRWVTTGARATPAGDTVKWVLRQTYDARTLQPYGIVRTLSDGSGSSFRIDGKRMVGTRKPAANAAEQPVDMPLERLGFVASASDLVPAAVGFEAGKVVVAPVWGPNQPTENRAFTIVGKVDIKVEGKPVNAWKVDEHRLADRKLLATWYLLDHSPYMVAGEVPQPDGSVMWYTEVEVPQPGK